MVYSVMCSEIEQAANWAWKVFEQMRSTFDFPYRAIAMAIS